MTGQGSGHATQDGISVAAEVRTVNSRYFKLALRASDGYSSIEPRVDEVVRRFVRRGTVQLDIRIDREPCAEDFRLNETALASYQEQLTSVAERLNLDSHVSLEALLALPGVVDERVTRTVDTDADWPVIKAALAQALAIGWIILHRFDSGAPAIKLS